MGLMAVGVDLSVTATGIMRENGRGRLIGRAGVTTLSVYDQVRIINGLSLEIDGAVRPSHDRMVPNIIVIEGLDTATPYGGQIERTALWWTLVERWSIAGLSVVVAASSILKMYATGKGAGPKGAVIEAVTRQWPFFEHRGNDNLADAAAACALGMHLLGEPLSPVTKEQERALAKVRPITEAPPRKGKKK